MDRRTLLAVVLSVIVITIGFSIQSILFPPPEPPPVQETTNGTEAQGGQTTDGQQTDAEAPQITQPVEPVESSNQPAGAVVAVPVDGISDQFQTYQNELIRVTLDPAGASIASFELLEHVDGDQPVNMVFRGSDEQRAMTMHFGDYTARPVTDLFQFVQIDSNTFEFYRDYYVVGQEDSPFRITRRYEFAANEHMFRHEVELANSTNAPIPLNFDGVAYTLAWGPQIGPEFEELDQRIEFRRYMALDDGRRQNYRRVSPNNPEIVEDRVTWAAIAGKYFAIVAKPELPNFTTVLAQDPREGLPVGSQLYVSRPPVRASLNEDAFYFYAGPKTPAVLDNYQNAADNAWGQSDLEFQEIQESRLLFGWLENILKAVLNVIVRVVPNYGIAIIILTFMVKLLLYPLTRKSYESNARMQAVQPKMQELREKYKDNQQKVNEEMAKLYKKEGVNPLGGCLPLLAQFPFFIAMYGLFNNHFDLRGATFIPGWITDLSAPDVIFSFGDFTLPLIGWTALRGLPIIFVGTQLLSTKFTQTATTSSSSGQMKFMQFGLPIIFFFILYNVPSGLLVYWIFSNLLTVAQQYYYNNIRKKDPPKDNKPRKGKKRP